jgi:magnesium chelatase family protein
MRYQRRLSGPLMDRMDLQVWVQPVSHIELSRPTPAETSEEVRRRVAAARRIQMERYRDVDWSCNAELQGEAIRHHGKPSMESLEILGLASAEQRLSARAWSRILKVARTVADLEDSLEVETRHVAEAASFRVDLGSLLC